MNTSNIKRYAPKARTAFIAAMTKRATLFGIRESSIPSLGIEPLEQKGDLALIGDRPFPASIIRPRAALVKKIEQMGFAQTMEQAAYSWFNRLCAIRYMELKGYLDHGRRVLSHPDHPGGFQILDECLDFELEGLDKQRISELKLDGTKDEELYREILLAQCHALHQAMPFLFEAVDDALELLLPDNLTKTDSLIRELVEAIPEENWDNVEIIGWLYQFYISEKKDQVIGKVVKSEDIPAATQLFTPNWIVQYLVQNSVGRQWLQTYPDSPLKAKMPYYIDPAEQILDVEASLAAITPHAIDPLTIKVLDPACGSGHILVEAYKVLKAIYEERGHRSREVPQLILENNLFGLDIDDRASQLAGFTLMMLAREDDRRIFSRLTENGFKLNVLSLQESGYLDFDKLWKSLNLNGDWLHGQSQSLFDNEQSEFSAAQADNRYQLLKTTCERFIKAKTLGSLIEVPAEDSKPLGELLQKLRQIAKDGDSMQKPAAQQLIPLVQQAWILAQRFDAVVANPPYMGLRYFCEELKDFSENKYDESKPDLYAMFLDKSIRLLSPNGKSATITMLGWLYTDAFILLRSKIIKENTIDLINELGSGAFGNSVGSIVKSSINIFSKSHIPGYKSKLISQIYNTNLESVVDDEFLILQGVICPSATSKEVAAFKKEKRLGDYAAVRQGLSTSDDNRFLRFWYEVNVQKLSWFGGGKWFPISKGGPGRKWYGNLNHVINWEGSGHEVKEYAAQKYGSASRTIKNVNYYFQEGITWGRVSGGDPAFRILPENCIISDIGCGVYPSKESTIETIALLNSNVSKKALSMMSQNFKIETGHVKSIPYKDLELDRSKVEKLITLYKKDWNEKETSMDFSSNPIDNEQPITAVKDLAARKRKNSQERIVIATSLEQQIKKEIGEIYGWKTSEASDNRTFLHSEEYINESESRAKVTEELLSLFIGHSFGRYSLDREGLVYAHAGNQGFSELVAEGAYKTFPADGDGILPLTNQEWFTDDATNRFREFVRTVWGKDLQENLDFVAESLCLHAIKPKRGESAMDTIRRYLSTQFFKDHLKTYKKRPIYWLFSSGKHKAFECLVYLHRYNEGTLARMRTEYVIPLTAKLNTYANKLATDIENETVTSEKKRLEKELATLHNQQAELATFDEKLRHHADQRINLDLDDGVKVNYAKFGDLLAEVKTITGGATE